MGLLTVGIGTVASGINIISTVWKLRTPGMTIRRLPLFVWMSVVNSVLIILALPALNASLMMLLIDRQLNAHFFQPAAGGSAVLWQHYFWAFGHPEVSTVGSRLSDAQITIRILNGGDNMHGYSSILTPAELNNLVAFLSSRKAP